MCKYGHQPGVLSWVNTSTDWKEVEAWTKWLEELSLKSGEKNFKAYLIYSNAKALGKEQTEARLSALGRKLDVQQMALTYVPALDDKASHAALNQINPETRNTFIVYVNRKVAGKFVNLPFDEQSAKRLAAAVESAGRNRELYPAK